MAETNNHSPARNKCIVRWDERDIYVIEIRNRVYEKSKLYLLVVIQILNEKNVMQIKID